MGSPVLGNELDFVYFIRFKRTNQGEDGRAHQGK
jgi:hypothetical protein